MRPLPGDDAFGGRPRTSTMAGGDSDTPAFLNMSSAATAAAAPQMTYFFADEASIGDSSNARPPASFHHHHHHHRSKDSKRFPSLDHPDHYSHHIPKQYPPRSSPAVQYEDRDVSGGRAISSSSNSKGKAVVAAAADNTAVNSKPNDSDDLATPMPVTSGNFPKLSSPHPPPPLSTTSNSRPTTPFLSAGPASTLGSISSRRNSLSLSSAPSVIGTDYDDHLYPDEDEQQLQETEIMESSGSVPQLVMPSIKMPSRRPFTEQGKQMGRLKVLIAGDSGVGKTSLIKAVVQSCESVVHVDSIVAGEGNGMLRSLPVGGRRGKGSGETREITEVWASTKPYPEWWSEVEAGGGGLGGRKSLGDEVLDRNVCFVDTMGYGFGSSSMDTITPVSEYIQGHLQRISSGSLSDGDVLSMLGGEGGVQVDVVFYMVSNRLRPVDIHYLRQLSPLTNIIILLAQTDLMSADQVAASKEQIYSQLKEASIRLFSFNTTSFNSDKQGVYATSSANGSDHDNMDASLLMSPDYVQPLFPTELATLVEQVFNKDGISRLRHAAARKYIQWRKTQSPSPLSLPQRSLRMSNSFSQNSVSGSQMLNPLGSPPSYALARITDHTQREERLAQVRFANWAADLQKSIATERAQYLALARGDRVLWLTERLNECIQEGSLVPVNSRQHTHRHRGRSGSDGLESQRYNNVRRQQQVRQVHRESSLRKEPEGKQQQQHQQNSNHDPLGLLEVAADLRRKGLVVLEVLGSIGVLGGVVVWVVDRWVHVQAIGWVLGEWERWWEGR